MEFGRMSAFLAIAMGLASCGDLCLREHILQTHSSSIVTMKAGRGIELVKNRSTQSHFTARVELVRWRCHPAPVYLSATVIDGGFETATVEAIGQVAVFDIENSGALSAICDQESQLKVTLDEE